MTGFTRIIASKIQDIKGQPLADGRAVFKLTDSNGRPTTARLGGPGGGLLISQPAVFNVGNGQLLNPSDPSLPCYLPDVSQTNPQYVGFEVSIYRSSLLAAATLVFSGFIQPAGDIWSLDEYVPVGTSQQVTFGPAPTLSIGSIASVPEGTAASASFTSIGLGAYALNLNVPRVPASYKASNVAVTSLLGCLGGAANAAHDDALVNSFLASATASTPALLVVDQWLTTGGIVLPPTGHVNVEGVGNETGFYLKDNANTDVIACGPVSPYDPGGAAPPRIGLNIRIANLRIEGNRANNLAGYTFGINLVNCLGVEIDRVTINHTRAYAIRVSNVGLVRVTDCDIMPFLMSENPNSGNTNTDGFHVNGPAEGLLIRGCRFRCGDDAIALNGPEGYSGSISDVVVSDCDFTLSKTFMRIYPGNSAGTSRVVDGVTATNLRGQAFSLGILIGNATDSAHMIADAVRNVSISDVDYTGDYPVLIAENCSNIKLHNWTWRTYANASNGGFVSSWSVPSTARGVSITGLTCVGQPVSIVDFINGFYGNVSPVVTASKFTVSDVRIVPYGTIALGKGWVVALGFGSTMSDLLLEDLDPALRFLTQSYEMQSLFSGVRGGALLGMCADGNDGDVNGAQSDFLDAVIGDGTFYFSRTQASSLTSPHGPLCLKRNGTAMQLTTA
jgi:hypothetical protein